ncbi:unnamed protein product [Strongylus vulgaris]|uniref:TAR DNA-binding protein 43 N-terminal domain-containing protein n=1 Tax=Strongylus vulgaris TaxID=40348 RepID=A0A3P7J1E5_STRVU|nr:unnamed protein product [Strongylus vulgaris]
MDDSYVGGVGLSLARSLYGLVPSKLSSRFIVHEVWQILCEAMELPTASDNTLYMTTLQATYPGATGMKYKNPKTGALRAVA